MNPLAITSFLAPLVFMIDGLCCNFQPCDAADVQEPTAQKQEDSTHELLDSNNGTCCSEQHLNQALNAIFFFHLFLSLIIQMTDSSLFIRINEYCFN